MVLVGAGIVTVNHKGMSIGAIRASRTAVQDGAASLELSLHHIDPVGGAIAVLLYHGGAGVVAELNHGGALVISIGAAAVGRILHLDGLPAVAHQPCYSIGLGSVVVDAAVVVKHVVPVHCHAGQSGKGQRRHTIVGIGLLHISVHGGQLGGVLPEVHHLGHRRGHTTRHAVLAIILGALVVVRGLLIPLAGHQLGNSGRREHALHHLGEGFHLHLGIGQQIFHLLLVMTNPPSHVGRQVVHVKVAAAVAQNLLGTIVTRHDDVTAAVIVEHIEVISLGHHRRLLGMGEFEVGIRRHEPRARLTVQEPDCRRLCRLAVHIGCRHVSRGKGQHDKHHCLEKFYDSHE